MYVFGHACTVVCVKVREQFMGVGSSLLHVGSGH